MKCDGPCLLHTISICLSMHAEIAEIPRGCICRCALVAVAVSFARVLNPVLRRISSEPFSAAGVGVRMFWYPGIMLAFEANAVINQRLWKMCLGGTDGAFESCLMITEKIAAGFEVASILARGGTCSHVIDHYRNEVAANALRLK